MSNLNEFKAESELGSPLTFLNASAGTGKTYSICKKLCYLFVDSNEENRIKPEEAAVITFTNNAARELKTRIQTFLTNEEEVADLKKSFGKSLNKEQFEKNRAYAIAHLNEASIGTIHHFCTEILGIVGTLADFDAGRTLTQDTSDLLEFTNNANLTKYSQSKSFARSFDSKSYQKTLEEAQGSFNRDMFFADLKGVFKPKEDKSSTESDSTEDEAKCTSIQPNSELLAWQRWTKDLAKLYGLLERTHSVMSNDSLLALTNEAVSSEPVVKLLQKRWKLVMVDEFQDTDINQWNIIKKAFLSSSNENSPVKVITVGDDKQSIYSFRGAEVENFRSARELAEKNNNKTYVLNINYRSDSCVVDAVNAITKELFDPKSVVDVRAHITDRRLLDGDLDGNPNSVNKGLFIRTSETEFKIKDIPDDVTHVINHLLKTYTIKEGQNEHRHIKPSDIAVLVNGKDKAREILSTLKDSRIPAVFTNTTSVFDEQAAKDWLDLLESLVCLSDHNLLKRVAIGPFGIFEVNDLMNDSALDEIITRWQEYKNHTQKGGFNLLWENIEAKSNFSQRVFTNWYGEDYYINALQVKNWLQKLWHENPSLNYLAEKLSMKIKAAAKNPRNAEDEEKLNIPTDESSVQIYTYHGSKGLQFPIVLLPYLAIQKRDDFNDSSNTRCLYAFSSSPNLQNCSVEELKQKKIEKESEENARIAYVAFTRAELLNVVWTNPLPEDNSSKETNTLPPLGRALANAKSKLNRNTFELTDDVLNSGEDVSNDWARSRKPEELYTYKHINTADLPELKYRTSYSSISANLKSDVMTSGGGNDDDDEIEEISDASNGKNDENLINEIKTTSPNEEWFNKELTADTHPLVDLEAGKDFGTQIHSAFENLINVRRSNPSLSLDEACSYAAKQTLIEKNLNSKDHEPLSFEESHERLTQALKQVFSISLNGPFEGKSFVDINPQNIRAELEFDFNLAPNSKSMLCCWKEHVHSDELLDFAERLGNAISMKGILTGSIDVLLRDDQGDYFIADWKTNNLSRLFGKTEEIEDPDDKDSTITVLMPRRNDYRHEFVVKEMKDATYLLQALIYAVAVYRITGKVPKGVAYLFVRGMGDQPLNNTEDAPGVFTWAIPEDLVIETNAILEGDSSHE